MKLDYECLKALLCDMENRCDGFNSIDRTLDLAVTEESKFAYHYKLAIEQGLVQGSINEVGEGFADNQGGILFLGTGKTVSVEVSAIGLTMQGHQLLEAMRNDTIWKKIGNQAKALGIEGLKQVPALAVKLLLS